MNKRKLWFSRIASIEHYIFEEELEHKDGWLQLDKGNVVAINGLDGYCLLQTNWSYQYARKEIPSTSFFKK
jgi:hypothetical protein